VVQRDADLGRASMHAGAIGAIAAARPSDRAHGEHVSMTSVAGRSGGPAEHERRRRRPERGMNSRRRIHHPVKSPGGQPIVIGVAWERAATPAATRTKLQPDDFIVAGDRRTYGDLITPTALASYAQGIGPSKRSIVPDGPA
jgi:hypothetical protein